MTDAEQLFLRTLQDLRTRESSMDPYGILGASGLLRKLLLDDYPLVDQVNRNHRIKMLFEIGEKIIAPDVDSSIVFYSVQDGIDPNTAPPFIGRAKVDRDSFLSTILLVIESQTYTVRDIILFEANVMGGVHAGSPKAEKQNVLAEIGNRFQMGGLRSSLRQLKAIIRVVLKAIDP